MKAWSIAVSLVSLGALAGCGGGYMNSAHLTQAQARQLGSTVSNDVSKALAGVVGNPAVPLDIRSRDNLRAALQRNPSQANAVLQPARIRSSGPPCTVSRPFN